MNPTTLMADQKKIHGSREFMGCKIGSVHLRVEHTESVLQQSQWGNLLQQSSACLQICACSQSKSPYYLISESHADLLNIV